MAGELVEIEMVFPASGTEETYEAESMEGPEIEVYLRVFTDTIEAAEAVLEDMGDEFFAPVTYLGSASLTHEPDTNVEDQCHLLIGLRGAPDDVSTSVDQVFEFIKDQTGVNARIQQLVVDHLIVSRTLSAGDLDLFDDE